ncbi:ImmA/IrrE family metallo-endopeptidase [Priestia koreensis]|uniref:ImmA/IrrE family metallo-endopeptidase n=1 Tax=Priestia koreensis TaxID=284581 RepID=UPI00203BFE1A|nr:ImmA/IrrE family metallo-endopeptidase [Priestia koreensis]MCM3006704.1 ImmA/IrrE family metallo-endopeptidase [Priestia koreensis]
MNRVKWAEKKANNLLESLNINQIPIPVNEIAQKLNIKISYEPFEGDLSGVLYRDNSHTIIGVNSNESDKRQRFTIAHELGHFILHEGEQLHVDHNFKVNFRDSVSSQGAKLAEIEANAFAASLLMPESLVREAYETTILNGVDPFTDDHSEEVDLLAKLFNVSQTAMLIRLGKLGLLV